MAYVWNGGWNTLHAYHVAVMAEMRRRGWNPSHKWLDPCWRGKDYGRMDPGEVIYGPETWPEHDALLGWQVGRLVRLTGKPKLWQPGELENMAAWMAKRMA